VALPSQTVTPTLMIIDSLAGCEPALSAAEHLHALALFDDRQLLEGRWTWALCTYNPNCAVHASSRFGRTRSGCGCTIWP
jgi:hypothetical protein